MMVPDGGLVGGKPKDAGFQPGLLRVGPTDALLFEVCYFKGQETM